MSQAQHMPPTSGFHYHCVQMFHVTRHYLDHHSPIGDPVEVMNVPGEESPGQSAEVSATVS